MTRTILLFIVIVILSACDHPRPVNKVATKDTILVKKVLPNKDEDSKPPINLAKPILISDEWIKEAWKYNGKRLPERLRKVIDGGEIDLNTIFLKVGSFSIQKVNLDDDPEQEIVVFINEGAVGIIGIIKQINKKWYLISKVDELVHYNNLELPKIDKETKLIRTQNEMWGTSISGSVLDFYRLIKGKLYHAFEYYEDIYIGIFEEGDLVHSTDATHSIYNSGQSIKVDYNYNLYKEKEHDGETINTDFYILKNQKLSLEYGWDSSSFKYKLVGSNPFKESKYPEYIGPLDFYNLYIDKIKYISQHGTKKQRKALEYLNKKPKP